jgi:micrococcal nuclease
VAYCNGSLAASLSAKLLKVEDGDTLVVESEGVESRIQLSGIDAPENTENAKLKLDIKSTGLDAEALLLIGKAATDYLQSLLPPGKPVMLEANMSRQDRYGRIPALVSNTHGVQLNEAMVENGYAAILTRYSLDAGFKTRLQQKQATARKENLGLWKFHPEIANVWFGD